MSRRLLLSLCAVYLLMLALTLPVAALTIGTNRGDDTTEVTASIAALDGWPITTFGQNNTSIVVGFVAPQISKLFSIHVADVYKFVFPFIYSLTAVLLYLLARRFVGSGAIWAVLLFLVVPPTYKEVPTIGKSMVAEPLAVGVLLVFFSSIRLRYKIPALIVLTLLTAISHYTIGVMLLGWLVVLTVANTVRGKGCGRFSLLLVPVAVGLLAALYFSYAGHGVLLSNLMGKGVYIPPDDAANIKIVSGVLGQDYAASFGVIDIGFRAVYYAIIGILGLGFLLVVRRWLLCCGNDAYATLVLSVFALLTLVAYFPKLQTELYLTRWIQINSIVFCVAFAMGAKWLPKWVVAFLLVLYLIGGYGILGYLTHSQFLPQLAWTG